MTEEACRRTINFFSNFRMLGFSMTDKDICWALFNALDVRHDILPISRNIIAVRDGILYTLTFNGDGKLIEVIESEADDDN